MTVNVVENGSKNKITEDLGFRTSPYSQMAGKREYLNKFKENIACSGAWKRSDGARTEKLKAFKTVGNGKKESLKRTFFSLLV